MSSLKIKVLEILKVGNVILVTGDLVFGDICIGSKIVNYKTKNMFEVINLAKVEPELYKKGRRGLTLKVLEGDGLVSIGDELESE